MTTPLGVLVVPDVNMIAAVSSSAGSSSGAGGYGAVTSLACRPAAIPAIPITAASTSNRHPVSS